MKPTSDIVIDEGGEARTRHRRSLRLQGYDYAQAGGYFVTICTKDRACLFGEVVDGKMRLNDAGNSVVAEWQFLTRRFAGVETDAFVVMPNHVHGIVFILPEDTNPRRGAIHRASSGTSAMERDAMNCAPTKAAYAHAGTMNHAPTLGEIVRAFKAVTTRRIRQQGSTAFAWQRNYYEHIIRNEDSLARIREYIINNPLQWAMDRENPANFKYGEP